MTGIFGTPIAAILLALEVLLFEWKPRSFVPVVVAVLTALAWRPYHVGEGPLFPFAAGLSVDTTTLVLAAPPGQLAGFLPAGLASAPYPLAHVFTAPPGPTKTP